MSRFEAPRLGRQVCSLSDSASVGTKVRRRGAEPRIKEARLTNRLFVWLVWKANDQSAAFDRPRSLSERPQKDGEDVRILLAAEEASSSGACDKDKNCLNQVVERFDNGWRRYLWIHGRYRTPISVFEDFCALNNSKQFSHGNNWDTKLLHFNFSQHLLNTEDLILFSSVDALYLCKQVISTLTNISTSAVSHQEPSFCTINERNLMRCELMAVCRVNLSGWISINISWFTFWRVASKHLMRRQWFEWTPDWHWSLCARSRRFLLTLVLRTKCVTDSAASTATALRYCCRTFAVISAWH